MHLHKLIHPKLLPCFFCCALMMQAKLYAQHFTTLKSGEGVEISESGKKVLFYQQHPKSLDGKYERAGYVHPLYSLNEKVLTEDFPEDHPYHRGIFWAWHQVIWKDKKVADGWTCENISWEPVKLDIIKKDEFVTLHSQMLWKSVLQNNKTTAIIKEITEITVYRSAAHYRAIDFDIRLLPLVDSLQLGGSEDAKGYGGFCPRLKLPADIAFVSNKIAVTPTETAVTAGPWMDFSGSFEGASSPKAGITVFCSLPGNSRQPWILRSQASMQNVPYPGRTAIPLQGKGWRLRYRVIVHDAGLSDDAIEKLYQQYIHKF